MVSSLKLSTAAFLTAVSLVAPDAEAVTWRRGYTYTFDHRGNVIEAIAGAAQVGGVAADVIVNDNPGGDGVAVRGNYRPRLGFDPSPTFTATTRFPWANIVRSMNPIGSMLTVGITAAYLLQQGVRWYEGRWQVLDTPDSSTPGSGVWRAGDSRTPQGYATPEAACRAYISFMNTVTFDQKEYYRVRQDTPDRYFCDAVGHSGYGVIVRSGTCPDGSQADSSGACSVSGGGEWRDADFDTQVSPKLEQSPPSPDDMPSIFDDIVNRGGEVTSDARGTQMSGPSSSRGPSSTTTTPQGTTTTNTTYNYNYHNNTVVITRTTTTTNPDGSQSSSETDDVRPEPEVALPQDPALPPVPDLYERRYPDGMSGVWAEKRAAFLESPLFAIIPALTPSLGSTGCPIWTLPLGPWGTHDISIPCWVWAAIRLIFICTALFTARKLIFGG